MATFKNLNINWRFLDENPSAIFVYGDNLQKFGKGGAAFLRDHPQAIGFITKKFPDNNDGSFYRPEEYKDIFTEELNKLENFIKENNQKTFFISKLGSGLANKYNIWEKLISSNLVESLKNYENVIFCWE
jgi:hypothetical protein